MTARRTVRRLRAAALAWPVLCAQALWLVGCGGGGSDAGSPLPNRLPVAMARVSAATVAQPGAVFDTTGTSDSDGSIASYRWDYGDGQTGSASNHTYAAPGTYRAQLTVSDNTGATASTVVTVTVCSADGLALATLSPAPNVVVCMQTSKGELVLELFPAQAPVTVANFLRYVDDGFYNGTLFHRVVPGFVAQGGGRTSGLMEKTATYGPIVLESNNGLSNSVYTLAMARFPEANSAQSEFFVNLVDNTFLNYRSSTLQGYAVFGQVLATTNRQAVLDAMVAVPTTTARVGVTDFEDVPTTDIVIRSAVRVP